MTFAAWRWRVFATLLLLSACRSQEQNGPEAALQPMPGVSGMGAGGVGASSGTGGNAALGVGEPSQPTAGASQAGAGGVGGSSGAGGSAASGTGGSAAGPVDAGSMQADAMTDGALSQPPVDGGGTPTATCSVVDGLAAGNHMLDHDYDGVTRIVQLHVPPSYDGNQPLPLVFNLHPFVLGGPLLPIWDTESVMNAKADEAGFIVVTPSGTGAPSAWNAGQECCGAASTDNVDDVGFILHLIDYVSQRACVDTRRVYATGMSNGGYLSSRLACEASDRITAIAPVVGHLSAELYPCDLARPVPVLHITGSEDSLARRTEAYERWVEMNGCVDAEEETYSDGTGAGSARCVTHDECDGNVEVTHCVVEAGHCWHSQVQAQATPGCLPTQAFHTPDQVWDFFSRFSLP